MKLQISFDMPDLDQAIKTASVVAEFADILEVGSLLIYNYGTQAVSTFKETFPQKTILADCKIVDQGKEAATLFANAQADWVTVMAGTNKNVIHSACTAAHDMNIKIMLDLLDASSVAQSALEAKTLGADALLFHEPYDEKEPLTFFEKWETIKGNTDLPIFVSAKIKRDTIEEVIQVNPDGIIMSKSITDADDPAQEAKMYYELISRAGSST